MRTVGEMRVALALTMLLVLAASFARAQEDFAKSVYTEIENSIRNEYEGMIGSIMRNSMAQPPKDEDEQATRAQQIEREKARVKLLTYNKAALFAFCAADADRARGPGAPPVRSEQNLFLRTCVELKFDQMRKFANISSYAGLFFPDRIAPCGSARACPSGRRYCRPTTFWRLASHGSTISNATAIAS